MFVEYPKFMFYFLLITCIFLLNLLTKDSISSFYFEFENLIMVVIDNIEGAIDISDFHEVRLEDTGLYFGYRIELL